MIPTVPTRGILAALWLPADSDGNLLRQELASNLAWLKSKGIHGVLVLGSTGEFPQMSVGQRKDALAVAAELAAPLPVIANISDIRPHVVAELGRAARGLGVSAVAIMAPGFYPGTQDDILEHFLHAADCSGLPVFLYNFPELVGTRINVETVAAFADRANMAGIKQSGGEFEYHKDLIRLGREKGFVVFSGADTRLPEVLGLGAAGCIGGLVNIIPELMLHIYNMCCAGAPGDARMAFERVQFTGSVLGRLTFPLNVAAGMEARGAAVGLPRALVSAKSREIYNGIVRDLGAAFAEWGLDRPDVVPPCTAAKQKIRFSNEHEQ